ncbi:hypothetical protein EOL96_00170 [Candidatus Saccharibacteria bacterium]|nr:hypothetical protein [Candidatus Saccharibacteria bacterium]
MDSDEQYFFIITLQGLEVGLKRTTSTSGVFTGDDDARSRYNKIYEDALSRSRFPSDETVVVFYHIEKM